MGDHEIKKFCGISVFTYNSFPSNFPVFSQGLVQTLNNSTANNTMSDDGRPTEGSERVSTIEALDVNSAPTGNGNGKEVEAGASVAPVSRGGIHDGDDTEGKIFVGGLSWSTTEEGLKFYFEKYGEVADVSLMMDKRTGQPR